MVERPQQQDHRRALAAEVWQSSVLFGTLLGALGAIVVFGLVLLAEPDPTVVNAAPIALILGVAFGFVVGLLVGVELGLFVFLCHRSLGAHGVATLMPLAALCVTQPLAVFLALVFSGSSMLLMLVVNAVLTVFGAWCIGRRYRKLAQRLRVH